MFKWAGFKWVQMDLGIRWVRVMTVLGSSKWMGATWPDSLPSYCIAQSWHDTLLDTSQSLTRKAEKVINSPMKRMIKIWCALFFIRQHSGSWGITHVWDHMFILVYSTTTRFYRLSIPDSASKHAPRWQKDPLAVEGPIKHFQHLARIYLCDLCIFHVWDILEPFWLSFSMCATWCSLVTYWFSHVFISNISSQIIPGSQGIRHCWGPDVHDIWPVPRSHFDERDTNRVLMFGLHVTSC